MDFIGWLLALSDFGTESRITEKYRSSGNISKIQSHKTPGKRLHHALHERFLCISAGNYRLGSQLTYSQLSTKGT